ncbi:hypothetical protein Aperf_G00000100038 [Anoplocephala perfoliata]
MQREKSVGAITPGGPAARSGQLQVGDSIREINGHSLAKQSHADVVEQLCTQRHRLELTVERLEIPNIFRIPVLENDSGSQSLRRSSSRLSERKKIQSSFSLEPVPEALDSSWNSRSCTPVGYSVQEAECYTVDLIADIRGFGFSVRMSPDIQQGSMVILRIQKGSPAYNDQRMQGPLECGRCHVQFATAEERIQHARKKHEVHLTRYPCTACSLAGYKNADSLQIHLKTRCLGLGWETRLGQNASAQEVPLVSSTVNCDERTPDSSKNSLKHASSKSLSLDKSSENMQKALTLTSETHASESANVLLSSRKRKMSAPAGKAAKIPKRELKSREYGPQDGRLFINQKEKSTGESVSLAVEPKIPNGNAGGVAKHSQKKSPSLEDLQAPLLKKTRRASSSNFRSNEIPEDSMLALEKMGKCNDTNSCEHVPGSNMLFEGELVLTSNEIPIVVSDADASSTSQIAKKSRSKKLPSTEIPDDSSLVLAKMDSKKTFTKRRFSQTESETVPSVTPSDSESHFALTTVAVSGIRPRTRANSMLVKRDLNGDVFINDSTLVSKKSSQGDAKQTPSLSGAGVSSIPLLECSSSAPDVDRDIADAVIEASPSEKTAPNETFAVNRLESVVEEITDTLVVEGNTAESQKLIHPLEGSELDSGCKSPVKALNAATEDGTAVISSRESSKECDQNVELDTPIESPGRSIVSSECQQKNAEENSHKAVRLEVVPEFTYQKEDNKVPTKAFANTKPAESVAAQDYAHESTKEASELSSDVTKEMEQKCASEEVKSESPVINNSQESCKGTSSISDILKPLTPIKNEQLASLKESEPDLTDASLDAKRLELKRLRESLGIDVDHPKLVRPSTSSNASILSSPVTPTTSAVKSPSSSSSNASPKVSGKLILLDWENFVSQGKLRPPASKFQQGRRNQRPSEEKYAVNTNAGEKSKSELQSTEAKPTTAASSSANVSANGSSLSCEKPTASTISRSTVKPNFGEKPKLRLQNKEAKPVASSKKAKVPSNEAPLSSEKSTATTASRDFLKLNAEEQSKLELQIKEAKSSPSSKNMEVSDKDSSLKNEPACSYNSQEPGDSHDRANVDDASSVSTIPFRQDSDELDDKIESESDVDSEAPSGHNEKMTMLSCPVCRLGGFATKAELKVHLTISCRQEPKKKKKKKEKRPIEWYCPGCPRSFGPFESAKALLDHLPTCHIRRVALFGGGGSRGKSKAPSLDPNDLPLWPLPLPSTPVTFGCPVCGCFFATASRLDQHRSEADHFHVVGRFLNTNGHFTGFK